ncbi:unnamed protein product [Calypogeia fissa]
MFSIAAINGGRAPPPRLDALQPTKEAQEACLAQTYQEALSDLQGGNLGKARQLLESILQDPIILQAATANEKNSTGLSPMLQLRFSTLKNLAETLYKQDKKYHSDALGYYLQAAAIDRGDSVLWNRLGTLACALGHLNIARIAFEQGLLCSPRNWLCMEKLAEVLIAIGDEEACRHTVKRLLKISPSHPRAKHIENVLEGSADPGEILSKRGNNCYGCFVKLGTLPRGLDLLEPQHSSLSFPIKRNLDSEEDEGEESCKKRKVQPEEVCLPDLSWVSILVSVVDYLQVNAGQRGESTCISSPQDGLSFGKVLQCPGNVPFVNGSIAVVADSRSASNIETPIQKLPAVETEKSSPSQLSALTIDKAVCNTPTEPVQPVSRHASSESLTTFGGERFPENARPEDMSISVDLNHTRKQLKGETSGLFKEGAVFTYEDVLPYPERRITRLERIRTQRNDNDGEFGDKDVNKDQIVRFRQLLEPYVCTVAPDAVMGQSHGLINVGSRLGSPLRQDAIGAEDSAGTFEDMAVPEETVLNEELSVQQFVQELKVNSGPYHVAHELLERLAATHCKRSLPISKLLMLESMTRQFSWKTRSIRCSLFLAETCLEMFLSSSCADSDFSTYLGECGFHLGMVMENAASNANFREKISSTKKSSRSEKRSKETSKHRDLASCETFNSGQREFESAGKPTKLQHKVEVVNAAKDNDWPLWVRFHWLKGQWQMFSGRQEDSFQELTLCSAILDSRTEEDAKFAEIFFPNSDVETVITQAKVLRKLYEMNIDKLLKHEAVQLVDQAKFLDLIDLLSPMLLPDNDSDKSNLGYDETKRGIVDSSPEYVGLGMLIYACEKMNPPNLWLALQCHARKLEFLCSAVNDINATGITFSLESIRRDRCSSTVVSDNEQGKSNYVESRLIADEVKSISGCASSIREQLGESGCMVTSSFQGSLLRQIQHLLLDSMCQYIKSHDEERSPNIAAPSQDEERSVDIHFDSYFFVDACVAFCKLQHLDANATLKQQVSLLGTVHDMLAGRGLCCAEKRCYGGEGAFLKLAIKHLGTVELRLRLTSGRQEGEADTHEVLETDKEDGNESSRSSSEKQEENRQGPNTGGAAPDSEKDPTRTAKEDQDEEVEQHRLELGLDSVMDQCFFCLYGLNLRGGFEMSNQTDGLTEHKNTNRGDYETQEQCAGVYQYILPYAKACSRARLMKLRKVLRAVYKQFPSPPPHILANKSVDHFLDDLEFDEEKLHKMVVSGKSLSDVIEFALKVPSSELSRLEKETSRPGEGVNDSQSNGSACNPASVSGSAVDHGEPYLEVYGNLYYLVSEVEDISASEKWAGFVLTKEGEDFVEQNAKLLKYDLCFNPLRFESWYKLAKIYDEEVDLMLNDGSKNINVVDWRANRQLTRRVEGSRRRARRCLLMTLALSNTPEKQSEIHELLALVFYDCLQNVAPSFDQRSRVPERDAAWSSLCKKAIKHFQRAFTHRPDWTHLLYIGKLCEKLCRPSEEAFDFYRRAVEMKSSAVDPVYRLHASRLKLLCKSDQEDVKTLQVIALHCYVPSTKEKVFNLLECISESNPEILSSPNCAENFSNHELILQIRRHLFDDCLMAMKVCVEGELKHYHKARFRMAHCLCSPTEIQDLDKAKEELAFCFRSSRSLFTINMWEIDSSLRKIRRKAAHQTNLDVQMPESSRKFITCVRKYLVLYLSLCEKTGDICTLERAFSSLKTDKKFSLCLDDLSRVALGKYVQALVVAICQADATDGTAPLPTFYALLEKFFNLFMEFGSSWPDSLEISLAEAEVPSTAQFSEDSIYGYIHRYLDMLENDLKLDTMEAINEKIRKRFRSLKPVASPISQVCQHSCLSWARALCYALASITPLPDRRPAEVNVSPDQTAGLIVDLQEDIFMASSYQVTGHAEEMMKRDIKLGAGSVISAMKAVPVKRATSDNSERATALLRSAYVFYRDSLSGPFPDGINLFLVAAGAPGDGSNGVHNSELDISIPRKLLLWAFTLVHGRTGTVAEAVKYCEEQAKPRKKSIPITGSLTTAPALVVNNSRE